MLWTGFLNIKNIYIAPVRQFGDLNKQPHWIVTFIFITIISIVIGYLSLPFRQEIMFKTLSVQLGEMRAHETLATANRFAIVGLLLAPVPLLIKLLIVSTLLYYSSILIGTQNINFNRIFSVVVHSELILLMMGTINILALEIKGIKSVHNIMDLQTIIGLEYFLPDKTTAIYLFTLLSNFNMFTIWYITVLTIGLSIICQLDKWKSGVIVVIVWLLGVGFQVAIAFLTTNIQTMLGK